MEYLAISLYSKFSGGLFAERIWILTEPIFSADSVLLDSGAWVPDACYKICVDQTMNQIRVMAFIIEQSIPPYTRLRERLVSVDEIEAATGIDFLRHY